MGLDRGAWRVRRDIDWRSPSIWFVMVMVLLSLAAGIGMRDPSPPDEPRFVLAAQQMVESGEWLLPHRGTEFYAEKPAVFMWLQAAAYTLLRDWRVAFLLPSLLAAMATLVLVWDLARRLWTRRIAWYAAGALFVCLQFGLQAKRGQIDMVLVGLTTLSLWALLRHLLIAPSSRLLWLGFFAAGVGTVTKGVGFLPLLAIVPWLATRRCTFERPDGAALLRWSIAALAFIAGTAVWLAPLAIARMAGPDAQLDAYIHELLFKQTVQRYSNAWHHVQPWWYYAQSIATVWLPGALLLPWLAAPWIRRIRRGDARVVVLLGWAALVLVFFSISPGKREVYIFPALPAMCLAAAPLLPGLLRRRGVRWALYAWMGLIAFAAVAASVLAFGGWSVWAERLSTQRAIAPAEMRDLLLWLLGFGVVGIALLIAAGRLGPARTLVLFTCALWVTYGFGLAPAVDGAASARVLMAQVATRIGPRAELGMVAWREQNLLQAQGRVVDFGFKQPWDVQWARASAWVSEQPRTRWLFVLDDAMSQCVDRSQVVPIGASNRRSWSLVPGSALRPGCVTVGSQAQADGE